MQNAQLLFARNNTGDHRVDQIDKTDHGDQDQEQIERILRQVYGRVSDRQFYIHGIECKMFIFRYNFRERFLYAVIVRVVHMQVDGCGGIAGQSQTVPCIFCHNQVGIVSVRLCQGTQCYRQGNFPAAVVEGDREDIAYGKTVLVKGVSMGADDLIVGRHAVVVDAALYQIGV